jgi:hypothetical protein
MHPLGSLIAELESLRTPGSGDLLPQMRVKDLL